MKKLGIYIHIPFCESRCIYCDFASTTFGIDKQNAYARALCLEIENFWNCKKVKDKVSLNGNKQQSLLVKEDYVVDTIYFGGGTPSVLTQSNFEKIVKTIKENFVCNLEEFSVEVNPNNADSGLFECYKRCGVTRLSFGAQTLNDEILSIIGRRHKGKDVVNAVELANKLEFEVSVDLMLGLPNQTKDDIVCFIKTLCEKVGHMSVYMLKVEEGTKLFEFVQNRKIEAPSDDSVVDMYDLAYQLLNENVFKRYEVSNFCKKNKECKHNIKYWTVEDYLGFGLSSHSLFENSRFFNTSDFEGYVAYNSKTVFNSNKIEESFSNYIDEENLTLEDQLIETIILGLRLEQGLNIIEINKKFCINFMEKYKNIITKWQEYLIVENDYIKIKPQYFNVMNSILAEFV